MKHRLFKIILNTLPRTFLIKISYWVRPFVCFYLRGNGFKDPIDGQSFRKFLPYGYVKTRANALSPSTFSLERHRLMWLYLQRHTDFFSSPLKVLHVAPEQCFYAKFKNQTNLDYITTDLCSPLSDIKADICNLPMADNIYDVIFCNHVLEHIADDKKAMQELYRVLKPNGWAILQVPQDVQREKTYEDFSLTTPQERTKHFGQYDHVRVYGKDYFIRLKNAGFRARPIPCKKIATVQEIKKYVLDAGEILPVVFKEP